VTPVPDSVARPGGAVLAGTVENRRQRPVGRGAADRRPDRRGPGGGDGRPARWPPCSPASRAWRVQLVDADPGRAKIAEALGVGFALPQDRARRVRTLVVHAQRHRAGDWPASLGTPHRGGHGPRTELGTATGRSASRSARPSTPAAWSSAAARSATVSPARREPQLRRPASPSPSTCSPTRRSTRLVTGEEEAPSRSLPDLLPRPRLRGGFRRCVTGSVTPTSVENRSIRYDKSV